MRGFALILTVLGLLPVVAYGGLTAAFRLDAIGFGTVFSQLPWLIPALGAGGLAAAVGALLLAVKKAGFPALVAGLISLSAFGMCAGPVMMRAKASEVPPIHDITTDTQTPPVFVAILPLRADAPNPPEYDRGQTAQQLEGYPDLGPLVVDKPYAEVFPLAVEAVKAEGMRIVDLSMGEGRIEAVATTAWFGFKDDVVLRLRDAHGRATVVDMRSKSRVGRSDVGANAARIEAVLRQIEKDAAAT